MKMYLDWWEKPNDILPLLNKAEYIEYLTTPLGLKYLEECDKKEKKRAEWWAQAPPYEKRKKILRDIANSHEEDKKQKKIIEMFRIAGAAFGKKRDEDLLEVFK